MEIDQKLESLGHNPKMSLLISKACEFALNYYPNLNKDFILKFLNDVKIFSVGRNDSMFEFMDRLSTVEQTGDSLNKEIVDSARGMFYTEPIIEENESGFILKESNKFILVNEARIDTTEDMFAVIAHECSHALKSQLEEYKIEGNTIYRRSGLSIETGKILKSNEGKISVNWYALEGLGIEETMATHFECQAVQSLFMNSNYYKKMYTYLPLIKAANLLQLKKQDLFAEINSGQIFPGTLNNLNLQDFFKNLDLLLDGITKNEYLNIVSCEQNNEQIIESLSVKADLKV